MNKKKVHALLIARQSTGDSKVLFFDTPSEAILTYQSLTNPLLRIISDNDIKEGEDTYKRYNNPFAVRFSSGKSDFPNETEFMDGGDVYFEVISKEVYDDATHYYAEFSECVDDSYLVFHNKTSICDLYNSKVDLELHELNLTLRRDDIVRSDSNTWYDSKSYYIFHEYEDDIMQGAFFGHNDVEITCRIGETKNLKDEFEEMLNSSGHIDPN